MGRYSVKQKDDYKIILERHDGYQITITNTKAGGRVSLFEDNHFHAKDFKAFVEVTFEDANAHDLLKGLGS